MTIKKTNLKKKADHLFTELIHQRGHCEAEGADGKACGGGLQTAHIINRNNLTLRWTPDNALLMCARHHLYWAHKSPLEFAEWFIENFPIQHAFLMREKNKLATNIDYNQVIETLMQELDRGGVI